MSKKGTIFLIVLSLMGMLLSFVISERDARLFIDGNKIVDRFEKQFSSLEATLTSLPAEEERYSILDDEDWAIHIWKADTLVYWNYTGSADQFLWQKEVNLKGGKIASVSRFKRDREYYQDRGISRLPILVSKNPNALKYQVNGLPPIQSYEINPEFQNKRGQYISLLSFLLLFISLLYFLVNKFRLNRWAAVISTTILGGLGLLFPIENFTKDIIASRVLAFESLGGFTIVDLIIITLTCVSWAGIAGQRVHERKLSSYHIIFVGFLSSSAVILLLKLAKEIASHPAIQLEIDKIFKFDKYSITILICLALMTLSHLLINIYFFSDTKNASHNKRQVLPFFILGVIGSVPFFIWISLSIPFVLLYVYLISFFTMIDLFIDIQRKNITWLIWWILTLSGFSSVAIFHIGVSKSREIRTQFVDDFFIDVSKSQEEKIFQIDQIIQNSDLFERVANPPFRGVRFDRKDLTAYVQNLLKEGGVTAVEGQLSLEGFDQYANSIFSNHFAFANQMSQGILRSKRINEYIYYNPLERQHILYYELVGDRENATQFYIILQYEPLASHLAGDLDFNFAVYKNGIPIYSKWQQNRLDESQLFAAIEKEQRIKGFEAEVAHLDNMSIIAYKKISALIKPISLFSYLFTLFGILIILITLVNSNYRLLRAPADLRISNRSSLRNRIQLVVILLVLFSFIVIGLLTSYYFNNVIINTNQKTITEQTIAVVNNISSSIRPATDNQGAFAIMHNKLDEISTIHNKPLALYTLDGELYAASDAIDDFARRLSFSLWQNILQNKTQVLEQAAINKDMSRTYIPLYHKNNQAFGVLSIGHNTSLKSSKNLLDFLSTILNVYVFLFLLAGAIAIIIANSITRPLTVLGQKLKDFKLGRRNEPLEWKSKDEIGALIQDYNNLIIDLEKSADVIAMTERDTAWREMAKQVAHEIKNPLTPMKLSIQYLQRAISSSEGNADLIKRVSSTLIEQIDNLTQIANEFSNFASMPMASNEKLLLNDIVEMIHELFRKREDMDIILTEPITDLYVYADKNHLIRILNNILKNAIQAIPTDRRGRIEISLYKEDGSAIIAVKDNGSGIPDDKKDKVFTPNFTTKSSGTGLGLAISVNMIEAFNGRIYFNTQLDKGTTFYVEIPLMRLSDHDDGITRVMLD